MFVDSWWNWWKPLGMSHFLSPQKVQCPWTFPCTYEQSITFFFFASYLKDNESMFRIYAHRFYAILLLEQLQRRYIWYKNKIEKDIEGGKRTLILWSNRVHVFVCLAGNIAERLGLESYEKKKIQIEEEEANCDLCMFVAVRCIVVVNLWMLIMWTVRA